MKNIYGFQVQLYVFEEDEGIWVYKKIGGLAEANSYMDVVSKITNHFQDDLDRICYIEEKCQDETNGLIFLPFNSVKQYMDSDTDPEVDYLQDITEEEGRA